ncbi:hypothetical protein CDL12_00436 [Handroanthus impetiginosus]|uniref:SWIM-type domain-containing protein n=1 Tax=Handroanthus impetiginosus TaxID=429701 RepID=A0A2G9IAN5_9LAMI|nr:hypothetical protein CDL12_00436 [Handroanthus impetiginosus]
MVNSSSKDNEITSPSKDNVVDSRVLQLVLKTDEEADLFYFNYGRDLGFDIRRYSKKTDKDGVVRNREWVCSFAGFYLSSNEGYVCRRRATLDLRCGCKACFRISRDRTDGLYKVTKFIPHHNHPLATDEIAHLLKCNRYISIPHKTLLSGLTGSGIRACKAMNYLAHIEGGPGKLPFKRKDDLQIHDKDLIFDFTLDDENTLSRLFWIDGMSCAQFKLFGDVLLFDSTYKTNPYQFPLVMLFGVNNHFKTCVFGAAILCDETVESYCWLLQQFKQADAAMRAAIKFEYPKAKHRICSWNLEHNALRNVGKCQFVADFGDLITANYNVEDFEIAWQNLIQKHDVANHPWVLDVYKDKECWSGAYCRGYFMAMMTSTQYKPCLKSEVLKSFENHAATVYTRKIFEKVQDEIVAEQGLILQEAINEDDTIFTFKFVPYLNHVVNICCLMINWPEGTFECQCLMLKLDGIPCRHIISALKNLQQIELPDPIIKYRWTVDIGVKLRKEFRFPFPFEDPQRRRYAQLHKECVELCLLSSQTKEATTNTINMLNSLVDSIQPHKMNGCSTNKNEEMNHKKGNGGKKPENFTSTFVICDPKRKHSRGAVREKKQHCSSCGQPEHNVNTCKEDPNTLTFQLRKLKLVRGFRETQSITLTPRSNEFSFTS